MKISLRFLILSSVLLTLFSLQAIADGPIKIMPLGDSLTEGCCNPSDKGTDVPGYNCCGDDIVENGGYRRALYRMLADNGYYFKFVGNKTDGIEGDEGWPTEGQSHQGTAGARIGNKEVTEEDHNIDGIIKTIYGSIVYDEVLATHQPDIILYMIGTNNLGDGEPLQSANELNDTLELIYTQLPNVTVLLAKIPLTKTGELTPRDKRPCGGDNVTDEIIFKREDDNRDYNVELVELAENFRSNGKSIEIVDIENALDYSTDMIDCLHPTLEGYRKMADRWFVSLSGRVKTRSAYTDIKPVPKGVKEPDLLGKDGVLDQLYGIGNLLRISDLRDTSWINLGATVLAKATFTKVDIPGSTQSGRIFGYHDDAKAFNQVFELTTSQQISKVGAIGGGRVPPRSSGLYDIRWGIDPNFSSQPSDNTDQLDHMVTWLVSDGPSKGRYVLAWEDFDDRDFNDLVVEVNNSVSSINASVKLTSLEVERDPTAVIPRGPNPKGIFTITATFTNISGKDIHNPFFRVTALTGGNLLLNSDTANPQSIAGNSVGATLTPNVDDRVLSPNESMTMEFKIGLLTINRFGFFVDLFEGEPPLSINSE